MKKLLMIGAAAVVVAFATPSNASYTQCTVTKDIDAVNRPGGQTPPRWHGLKKGEKVAKREVEKGWVFIIHFPEDSHEEYGWIPVNVLVNCQAKEGTP